MPTRWLLALSLVLLVKIAAAVPLSAYLKNRAKIVVFIVVDQLRSDYLTRFYHRFLPPISESQSLGGYRFLLEKGAWYPQGQYTMLQNMTGPGHAVLLTGSYPYLSGIPINEWINRKTGKPTYCVEDLQYEWSIGPASEHVGTSPHNLIGTTVGDELKNIKPDSRVFSVALKDRAAILLG